MRPPHRQESRVSVPAACTLAVLAAACTLAGCASVPINRFRDATRIDVMANPGYSDYGPEFQTLYDRVRRMRTAACQDPEAVASVYQALRKYDRGWSNYWAVPPGSPPIVLIFHNDTQWLGTLDVYEGALGHVHNLVRKIPRDVSVEIVRTVCDCAAESGNTSRAGTSP